jgi:hypothetical protein
MGANGIVVTALGALALVGLGAAGWNTRAGERRAREALEERLARLEQAPARAEPPAQEPALARELERLGERLARLEASAQRAPAAEPREARDAPGPAASAPQAEASERARPAARAELEELLGELAGAGWDFGTKGEELQRFLALAREEGVLDEALAELEARVAAAPGDVEARMALADHYIGKLMTVSGPEQGVWGGKAEQQWQAVVEHDPEHWRAHTSLGIGYAYYPPVMGKAPLAIEHLERALAIRARGAPDEGEVESFVWLARVHLQNADREQARAVLERGLARFPARPELLEALEQLGG